MNEDNISRIVVASLFILFSIFINEVIFVPLLVILSVGAFFVPYLIIRAYLAKKTSLKENHFIDNLMLSLAFQGVLYGSFSVLLSFLLMRYLEITNYTHITYVLFVIMMVIGFIPDKLFFFITTAGLILAGILSVIIDEGIFFIFGPFLILFPLERAFRSRNKEVKS